MIDTEIEKERLTALAATEIEDPDKFIPGSFGCHEALHTASVFMEMVYSHLVVHPTILQDSEFYRHAHDAHDALLKLYQAIGAKHLD